MPDGGAVAGRSGSVAGERPTCSGVTTAGVACRFKVLAGGAFCVAHDPAKRGLMQEARRKGAVTSNKLRVIEGKRRKLGSAADLIGFTSDVVQDVIAGTVLPDVARAALYGISIQRQLIEASDIEQRLAALEQRGTATHQGGRPTWGH